MKVSACTNHGRKRWRVTWRAAGRTKRRFFTTSGAAKAFAKSIEEERRSHGDEWSHLPAADKAAVLECLARARAKGYTLQEACRFLESHKTASSLTLPKLVQKFMTAKRAKKLRPESIRLLETTLEDFMEGRETRPASLISTDEIETFLDSQPDWGVWRHRGAIIDLSNLFAWATRKKLIPENPMHGIERPIIEQGPPSVLSPDRAKEVLKLCRDSYPKLLPWLAISLFAGLRAAEVERLQWDQVGASFIDLRATQTKGRARRLVTIRPVLAAWLTERGKGSIWPPKHGNLSREFRKVAGGLERNVLRHSFISYAIGAGETVENVAMEAGNTPEIIFQHYREVVTPAEAKAFWALMPYTL